MLHPGVQDGRPELGVWGGGGVGSGWIVMVPIYHLLSAHTVDSEMSASFTLSFNPRNHSRKVVRVINPVLQRRKLGRRSIK